MQLGQEILIRVTNKQGSLINNGSVVYISGATGNNPEVKLANANSIIKSKVIAVATEDIANNQKGYVTTYGLVREINTNSFSEGDEIYLNNVDGEITNIELDHPNYRTKLGYVIRKSSIEGVILVTIKEDRWIQRFRSMNEPTGFDANSSDLRGDLSFNDVNYTLSLSPKAGQSFFNFWISGNEYRRTVTDSIIIDDTIEGIHIIYYDETPSLQVLENPTDGEIDQLIRGVTGAIVSIIYWDATNKESIIFNNERHLNQMDGNTHSYLHHTRGAQWLSGGTIGGILADQTGQLDSHAQFSVSSGSLADEDLPIFWNTISATTGLPILYKMGVSGNWRKIINSGFSVVDDVTAGIGTTGRLVYNQFTGGIWQLTTVANRDYMLCHVIANSGEDTQIYAIMGENDYANLNLAREGAITEINDLITSGLPSPEFIFLGSVIFQTGNTSGINYANGVQAKIVSTDLGNDYVDFRTTELNPSGAPGNHSNLTGLNEDDHLQYALLNGRSGDILKIDSIAEFTSLNGVDFVNPPVLPSLTTTQRDALTAKNGMLIYNTTTNKLQGYENIAWIDLV